MSAGSVGIPPKPDGTYRVLHTADWHLGKQLSDRSREEEQQRFLDWLLSVVQTESVDAILVAGDIFDSANPAQSTLALYYNFVSKLFKIGGRSLVVVAGNHDSPAHLEAPKQALRALDVHVVGFMPERPATPIICLPNEEKPKVLIAAIPFLRDRDLRISVGGEDMAAVRAQIVNGIRERYADAAAELEKMAHRCPAIAVGHLTVLGAKSSDSERDIHVGGLGSVAADIFPSEFEYIALGHLHRPQAIDSHERVRYAGSPMPLSFSEADDRKEIRILDVNADGIIQHSATTPVFRRLAQIRTASADLDRTLKAFKPEDQAFETWIEVVVEDATLQDEISERVQFLAEKLGLAVLKVLAGSSPSFACITTGEIGDDEAIESLLEDPGNVFEHLLAAHDGLAAEELADLRASFAQIVEIDAQNELAGSA